MPIQRPRKMRLDLTEAEKAELVQLAEAWSCTQVAAVRRAVRAALDRELDHGNSRAAEAWPANATGSYLGEKGE